jgi:L,D-transpeptidase catalytic domain
MWGAGPFLHRPETLSQVRVKLALQAVGATAVLACGLPAPARGAQELSPAPASAAAGSTKVPVTATASDSAGARVVPLSDERTETVAANVSRVAPVRTRPSASAPRRGWLRRHTFFGSREVVLVLGRTAFARGGDWAHVRYSGIGRRRGWVRMDALTGFTVVRTMLIIERGRRRMRLLRRGREVFRAPVGVGAAQSPTPGGRYFIRERLVPQHTNGIYGALAFGISAYSRYRTDWPGGGQVGVHGTNQPYLIPGWISNGCVRLRNRAVRKLDRLAPVGTPILIR